MEAVSASPLIFFNLTPNMPALADHELFQWYQLCLWHELLQQGT